jgi:glycosyltransferase involved in cell wall biosynthesis
MASARPVVASRVGGVPEIVEDGKTGLLVPPEDHHALAEAIIRLGGNRELVETMGQAGRQLVAENFTWEKSLDLMSELYERLIHESKKS